jgi:hypothetical protein
MADGMAGREPDEGEADAAQAFEGLWAEVAALRQGIELVYRQGQQAAAAAPAAVAAVDYSPTLGAMAKELKGVEARLKAIEGKPALGLTPSAFEKDIWQAGLKASEQSVTVMQAVKSVFEEASKEFKGVLGGARARREQELWVGTAALLGVIAGVVLWFLAVGLLPWGLGHRMAAAMVGGDRWNAGSMLMEEANPEAWDRLVRLDKACGSASVELCEAALALRSIPPVAPIQPTPAPEAAKPTPSAAMPAPSPPHGNAGAGR